MIQVTLSSSNKALQPPSSICCS